MINKVLPILAAVFVVVLAGIFAGAETGLYRLSRLRLRLGVERKYLRYILLGRCVHDSTGLLLSMLIGTNLAHYIAASIVTLLLFNRLNVHTAELIATSITAPVLFVFSELIPKNIFFYRSDFLMPVLAPFLYVIHKIFIFCGAVPLLKSISDLFARLVGYNSFQKTAITSSQRRKVQAILEDTHEEGILSSVQTDIINRLVKISNVSVRSVMIPVEKVCIVSSDADYIAVLNCLKKYTFTRLPVVEPQTGDFKGFINIYEVLSLAEQITNLDNFIRPIQTVDADTTVVDVVNLMQKEHQKMLLVTGQSHSDRHKPIGIVTMKDLVEELLGELAEW